MASSADSLKGIATSESALSTSMTNFVNNTFVPFIQGQITAVQADLVSIGNVIADLTNEGPSGATALADAQKEQTDLNSILASLQAQLPTS